MAQRLPLVEVSGAEQQLQPGDTLANAALLMPTTITPAALGGVVNDYNPAGLATCQVLRQDAGVHSFITGIAAQLDGQRLAILNISANIISIQNENVGSAAANRITGLPQSRDWDLMPGDGFVLQYSVPLLRWFALSPLTGFSLARIEQLQIDPETSPPALPANPAVTDDWNPTGLQTTTMIHVVTATAGSTLGGIVAPTLQPTSEGRILVLENHGDGSGSYGTSALTLLERAASSGVFNRFVLPNLEDLVLPYTGSVILNYDNGAPGWIALGVAIGGRLQKATVTQYLLADPLTPALLPAGNTNNFNPGLSTYVRLDGANIATLTGYVPTFSLNAAGQNVAPILIIENVGGSITISDEDANSLAGNRFALPFGSFQLLAGELAMFVYDTQGGGTLTQSRWRLLGSPPPTKWTMATEITPNVAAGDNPDWNPAGFGSTSTVRMVPLGVSTISGMLAQEDGAIRTLIAFGGPITLLHQSALSLAANRFFLPTNKQAGGIVMNAGDSVVARYDALFRGWFIIAEAQ
jgi:hypothetical protein